MGGAIGIKFVVVKRDVCTIGNGEKKVHALPLVLPQLPLTLTWRHP
jgi:hypothetical protein